MLNFKNIILSTLFAVSVGTAHAATPADTLVIAKQIDQLTSLDPAETFEVFGTEVVATAYERLINYNYQDPANLSGGVAESWSFSPDGKTMTIVLREGERFASGNPVRVEDVLFSLQRLIRMDKAPAFMLGQFGLTPANALEKIRQTGPREIAVEFDKAYAPTLILYTMSSWVTSIVDSELALKNEKDGDFGNGWLKTHSAGSGAFVLRDWKANEIIVLDRNAKAVTQAPLARIIYRHIKETATQRLLLEKGDIDVARDLGPEEIGAVRANPEIKLISGSTGRVEFLGLNQKNANLAKPEVRKALKYLVDYQAIADTIMQYKVKVNQTFIPEGFLGALGSDPYALDPAKAKELLAKAGLPDGFAVTLDFASNPDNLGIGQALQRTFAQGGVKLELLPSDGKQAVTKYRARQHEIYMGGWTPDYQDPDAFSSFAANANNADTASEKLTAWRNAWDPGPLTALARAAAQEPDAAKRADMYRQLQTTVLDDGPYVMMFERIDVAAIRNNVEGYRLGSPADARLVIESRKN